MSESDESPHIEDEQPIVNAADEDENRKRFTEELLKSVDTYMVSKNILFEKKLEKLVHNSGEDSVEKATQKIKKEMPELTRPGCKDQYNHNVEVLERIEAAEKHIRDAELKEALMKLAEGNKIVPKRQNWFSRPIGRKTYGLSCWAI